MKSHSSLIKITLLLLILLLPVAQNLPATSAAEDEGWLPISGEELALKASVVEPDADAEAIFWKIRVDDGNDRDLILSHYVRIKIFTERGRQQQGKIDIPFLDGTKIKDVAARTIKSDGSILEVTKNDIIERTIVKVSGLKLKTKTFALPGVELGSIVEYRWREVISYGSANQMRLQFQREIPVQTITYLVKPNSDDFMDVREFNMDKPIFRKDKNGFYSTTVKNMPAFHEEPLMPPEENVRAWAMLSYRGGLSLFTNYPSIAQELFYIFRPYLEINDEVKRKATEITSGASSPEEKLDKIYRFCRTSIKNAELKTSGFTDAELEKLKENKKPADTLLRGVGASIDINLLFAALAKASGFETHVVLVPDRGKRIFDKHIFISGALRPTNIAVRVGNDWKFYDPGLQFIDSGMLRWQEEGVDALMVDPRPVWVTTPISGPDKSKEIRTATLKLDENGTLEGDVTVQYTGHLSVDKKLASQDLSLAQQEEDLKEAIKVRLQTAELSNISIENVTDPSAPLTYKFHVRVSEYAQRTGKRLFLQPGFFEKGTNALFTSGTRKYPVYFHYPWSEQDNLTIILPKGFSLDNAEQPAPISVSGVCGEQINMGISKDGELLVYKRMFFFGAKDAIYFPAENYGQLKSLFEEITKADNHIITLKQASQ